MMNLQDIRASYAGERKESGLKDPWAHYIARPISFYIAWLLIRWGISANKVTFAGLGIGVVGCAFLAYGSYWAIVLGAVLVNIYGLSDYIDGAVARATGTTSEYGARIDGVSYLIITAILFTVVGVGLREPVYLALGVLASYMRIFRYAVTYQAGLAAEESGANRYYRLGIIAITAREPLLLVCAITGTLHWFLVFYVVIHFGELAVILARVFRR